MIRASFLFFLILVISCVEPYAPPISDAEASATMVVDGFIDGTRNIATIKLIYASALSDTKETRKLTRASMWIEDERKDKINRLKQRSAHTKVSEPFSVRVGKYQLHIDRGTNTEYHSDFVELLSRSDL